MGRKIVTAILKSNYNINNKVGMVCIMNEGTIECYCRRGADEDRQGSGDMNNHRQS